MAFCQGYKPELQVNHIDCVRTNNHFSNLEWVTARENQQHTCAVGNLKHKVLTLQELEAARNSRSEGHTCAKIAEQYGVTEASIRAATLDLSIHLKPLIPEETIAEMRRLRAKGDTMISIAKRLGVGHTVVWRNCHDVLGKGSRAGAAGPKQTPQNVIEAMRLQRWALGDSYDNIAKAHGVSKPSAIKYCKDVQIGLGV
jgi:DNA-binding CsgD family transcriptional regulator